MWQYMATTSRDRHKCWSLFLLRLISTLFAAHRRLLLRCVLRHNSVALCAALSACSLTERECRFGRRILEILIPNFVAVRLCLGSRVTHPRSADCSPRYSHPQRLIRWWYLRIRGGVKKHRPSSAGSRGAHGWTEFGLIPIYIVSEMNLTVYPANMWDSLVVHSPNGQP